MFQQRCSDFVVFVDFHDFEPTARSMVSCIPKGKTLSEMDVGTN